MEYRDGSRQKLIVMQLLRELAYDPTGIGEKPQIHATVDNEERRALECLACEILVRRLLIGVTVRILKFSFQLSTNGSTALVFVSDQIKLISQAPSLSRLPDTKLACQACPTRNR